YTTVLRIPIFLAFPAYLMGHVALGGLMQLGSAFTRLVTTLSWFIFSYKDMAELAATTNRLAGFMEKADAVGNTPSPVTRSTSPDNSLHIRDLVVNNPLEQRLIHLPELTVRPGEAVWIDGPSGIGKSTFLKALAGIWPHCSGQVALPAGKTLFLPQKAYLPLGSLAECLTYPEKPDDMEHVRALLYHVGLTCPRHEKQLDKGELSSDYRLSGGEQQRLMVARILAARPDWVFLDEATSSLDAAAEKQLYQLLRTSLPYTGFVVIAHREPQGLGSFRRVSLWNEPTQTTANAPRYAVNAMENQLAY
ncbi:MAG: ATP-binding cassette domain-containing protein, partial [Oxalobacter sp.]|nr:ATP-binding cassette domain-containing protein [Oxalobacter sp.]